MDDLNRISMLVTQLNKYRDAYYNDSESLISDAKYDDLFDELKSLEERTGVVFANSPTQTVGYEVKSELKKVKHSHPMMSLDKTKLESDLEKFSHGRDCVLSLKLDGLTILNTYNNSKLSQSETRGNGDIGEAITHNAKMFDNLPLKIPYDKKFEIEGEAIITYSDFEKINETISDPDKKYKNPRNLASGSVRQLDSSITKKRHVKFIVWKVPFGVNTYSEGFTLAKRYGFDVVPWVSYNSATDNIHDLIETLKNLAKSYDYPIDGIVISYNDVAYGKSLGMTGHHPRHSLAFKFYDEEEESTLRDIEWSIGRSGILTPIAIFNDVVIDNTTVNRASLSNLSVMNDTLGRPFVGETIWVTKRNAIIPKVERAEKYNSDIHNWEELKWCNIPTKCPICGSLTGTIKDNNSEVLICTNLDCQGKLLGKLCHFVSRDAINIDGLSEATIQFLIQREWIKKFQDIYHLKNYATKWSSYSGFGKKSVDKILEAIEASRHTTLAKFLYSLSIPLCGKSASEIIAKAVDNDFDAFMDIVSKHGAKFFSNLNGVGDAIINSINSYFEKHQAEIIQLSKEFTFDIPKVVDINLTSNIVGKTFVITGALEHFTNRNALKKEIEANGGNVTSSVTTKTNYLICNDKNSTSEKCKKAHLLGVKIISEDEFLQLLK